VNVIFLGPPGSGKGTQAKRVAERFKLTHISTGDVFREAIGKGSELGKEIKAYVDNGKLVPDELVSRTVFEHLRKLGMTGSYLLDGYPRTVDQAHDLDGFSQKEHMSWNAVVFFDIEAEELVKRLTARRQCPKCKEVFNLVTRPPKKEGICDLCATALTHRPDDQEDVIRKRLDVYDRQTAPVLDHYNKHAGFIRVDAKQDIDPVYNEVERGLAAIKAH
jgi:adenylate kinase